MENKITLSLDMTITRENVSDILCTALYGGVWYWCPKVHVVGEVDSDKECYEDKLADHLFNGGTIDFYEDEEETGDEDDFIPRPLNLESLVKGIKRFIEEYSSCLPVTRSGGRLELECGEIDANDADTIIQLACLGDVIYG